MIPYFSFLEISFWQLSFQIWGIMVFLGFLTALAFSIKEARRKNIEEELIWNAMILSFIGIVLGSRLFYIVVNFSEFENLLEIFNLQKGGFSFFGGMFFSLGILYFYSYKRKLNLWKILDIITPGVIMSLIAVRIGCFIVYDHIGKISNLPWGRIYIDQTIRHPISLYYIINLITVFCMIYYFDRKYLNKKIISSGILFLTFAAYYFLSRFFLDFVLCSDILICEKRYFFLTINQFLFLLSFLLTVCFLLKKLFTKKYENEH